MNENKKEEVVVEEPMISVTESNNNVITGVYVGYIIGLVVGSICTWIRCKK